VPSESEKQELGGYSADLGINEKVMVAIVKAAELYKKDSDAIFKNYGLTFSQYNVLRVLNNSKDGQNSVTNASKIMLVSSPNMTGIAKRLEKNGFIIRGKNDSTDERITLLEITPKGKRVLENIREAHEENMRGYMKSFSDDEKKNVLNDLKRVFNKSPLKKPSAPALRNLDAVETTT
jgi:DNA-binding MarR family transcriptional regulator